MELLVVITIIGILISLLLPAVQAAREAARQMQCQNNLKQLALALHNYHDRSQTFPPAMVFDLKDAANALTNHNYRPNWVINILPFMELQGLYDSFNRTQYISATVNAAARAKRISAMICPTDAFTETLFKDSNYGYGQWARGCYGANCSLGGYTNGSATSWKPGPWQGVMGHNIALPIAQIRDGTSNTILLGELRAGIVATDPRGVWALGAAGSSVLAGHCSDDDNGPNNSKITADNLLGCSAIQNTVGGATALVELGMPCNGGGDATNQATMRSMHVGGVNVAMADGSIRFISDYIEKNPVYTILSNNPSASNYGDTSQYYTWERLNSSNDSLPIDGAKF